MKRFLAPMVVLISILFIMGMGEMGGAVPPIKFRLRRKISPYGSPTGRSPDLPQPVQPGRKVYLAGKRGAQR